MLVYSHLISNLFQILECLDGISNPLTEESEENDNTEAAILPDDLPIARDVLNMFSRFWVDDFLTDLTLLVGPAQVPIKVHRVILAAHFEYFKAMFSTELKESTLTEVHLPFVGPEDLRLLLSYAYSGKANLTKENIFKMVVMASYLGCANLIDRCYTFIKRCINLQNCVQLVEIAFHLNNSKLEKDCVLFIVDHLAEVKQDGLSALPLELLLEIIQHPAAVISCESSTQNEEELFYLVWSKIKSLSGEEEAKYILKIVKAIHLPVTMKHFLFFLLREYEHISEAKELIMKAGDEIDPTEMREWYLARTKDSAWVQLFESYKPINVNGITTYEYSECILINGFPFFILATSPSDNEKEYHVESPLEIEHLGLPYQVVVLLQLAPHSDSRWIPVNRYRNGVVKKTLIRKPGQLIKRWVAIKVHVEPLDPAPIVNTWAADMNLRLDQLKFETHFPIRR